MRALLQTKARLQSQLAESELQLRLASQEVERLRAVVVVEVGSGGGGRGEAAAGKPSSDGKEVRSVSGAYIYKVIMDVFAHS